MKPSNISEINFKFTLACHWSFPNDQGGVGMHNWYLLQMLSGHIDILMVSSINQINELYYQKNCIPYYGIDLSIPTFLPKLIRSNYLKNGLRSWKDWRVSIRLKTALETLPTNVVEFIDIHSNGYVYLKRNQKSNRKEKVIIRSHTPWGLLREYYSSDRIKGTDGWFAQQREKQCFQWADSISTPSVDLKNKLIEFYEIEAKKIFVIPNILDTNHFKPLNRLNKNKEFILLHVGRFEIEKGVETLIKAFIAISKKFNNVKLINVGTPRGPSFNKCMKLLKKNKLDQKVIFTGFVDYLGLPEFYAKSDIVIVPSEIYESFSYTVAQGMACGKPVIASEIGGIPETTNYGNAAMLFEPGDVDQLTDKIEKLYANSDIREKLGRKARKYIVDYCSIESLKLKYIEFYQSILN